MKKIKYVGKHPVSIMLIDGGIIEMIQSGQVISVPEKDFDSLIELAKETHEWVKEVK